MQYKGKVKLNDIDRILHTEGFLLTGVSMFQMFSCHRLDYKKDSAEIGLRGYGSTIEEIYFHDSPEVEERIAREFNLTPIQSTPKPSR